MPDIWAYCDRCARWFYCSKNEREAGFVCPACGTRAHVTRQGRPEHPAAAEDDGDGDAPQSAEALTQDA